MLDGLTMKATKSYRSWLGDQPSMRVELRRVTTLAELLDRLARASGPFPALPTHDRAALQTQVLVYDGRRFLAPTDEVEPGSVLELLPPTAGG